MFLDRQHAGERLSKILEKISIENGIVLALARGGVPVGFEIAKQLKFPLNVLIVRKISSPQEKEFGIGAIAEKKNVVFDKKTILSLKMSTAQLDELTKNEIKEINRQLKLYRNNNPLPDVKNKTVIIVDDGLATGVTIYAALKSVKKLHPKKIILALPVCPRPTYEKLQRQVDTCICLQTPRKFHTVGEWYKDFRQISDEEVIKLLQQTKNS